MELFVELGYKDFFSDYDTIDISKLLQLIPSIAALKFIAGITNNFHADELNLLKQRKLFNEWLSFLPQDKQKVILLKIKEQEKTSTVIFFNNVTLLSLTSKILENMNNGSTQLVTADYENLYLAYLYLAQKNEKKPEPVKSSIDYLKIILPIQFSNQELLETKNFITQTIKVIYFFKFCESNEDFNEYLNIFLKEYSLPNWQTYIKYILEIYSIKNETSENPVAIIIPPEFKEGKLFMEKFCVDVSTYSDNSDFLSLRNHPIFALDDDTYLILNRNFFVDKIYQGIQFDFAKFVENKGTYKGKLIKSTGRFMTVFGECFAENGLFYDVMKSVIQPKKYVSFTGSEMCDILKDSEPDYYLRKGNKIFVFEFKNIVIASKIKASGDFDKIKDEIFKKLVQNESGKPKGVTQLVNTISQIKNNNFKIGDTDYNSEKVIIYPILVHVDYSLLLPGVNMILNTEFRNQLNVIGLNDVTIKDLTLIDLDSLVEFQDLFYDGKLTFNHCINNYIQFKKKNMFASFNIFLHEQKCNKDREIPKIFDEITNKLFKEDE